ncbi:type II toxin-antitoxin system RelE/ParE family toxin [Mesorhizobium sp. M8A.F.Ca.ET.142.01.1.1]|uniref:type II toxin-antitoxin system RelE/ParE family toxin n=1 Tax=unclassified Mesorhizobium TaxID=325217 RepID=UPI0032B0FB9A
MNLLTIQRSARAEEDLVAIWLHIARDNEVAADRLLDRFEARWLQLAAYPFSGAPRDDIAPVFVTWSSATTSPCTESVPMPSKSSVCRMVGERSRSMISIPDGSLSR